MSDFKEKYGPVGNKLVANMVLWSIFMVVFVTLYAFKYDLELVQNVPLSVITPLISWYTFGVLFISSFILFAIFSLITHKSDTQDEIERGTSFMNIALTESSGVLFNFGSLTLAVTLFTQNWLYLFVTIFTYLLGIMIHPKNNITTIHSTRQ